MHAEKESQMKKIVQFIVFLIIVTMTVCAEYSVSYDENSFDVTVNGRLDGIKNIYVIQKDDPIVSSGNMPIYIRQYEFENENSKTFNIGKNLKNSVVYAVYVDNDLAGEFVFVDITERNSIAKEKFSAAADGNDLYSVINDNYGKMGYTQNPVSQKAAAILYTFIPFDDAKDFDAKLKKANALESLNNAKNNEEVKQIIEDNEKIFGTNIQSLIKAMTEKERGTFLSLLGKTNFTKRSFEDAAEEFEAVAKCVSSEHWTQLSDNLKKYAAVIKKYESAHSFDLSAYDDSKIEKVCAEMIKYLSGAVNADDIVDKFKNSLKTVEGAGNQGGSTRPSGGNGGGGKGGGYVIDKSYNNATDVVDPDRNTDDRKKFSDMGAYDWAEESVYELNKKGIISGKTDDLYEPGSNITRAEFSKLICKIFNFENRSGKFADVADDSWYAPFVYALSSNGVVSGADGRFYPENDITREDAAVILYRAYNVKGINISGTKSFADDDRVSDYAKEAVSVLGNEKVIAGFEDGRFLPQNNLTRAEAAVLLYRVYREIN